MVLNLRHAKDKMSLYSHPSETGNLFFGWNIELDAQESFPMIRFTEFMPSSAITFTSHK